MSDETRFESVESQQASALREIVAHLERLNKNIEKVLGEHTLRVVITETIGVTSVLTTRTRPPLPIGG